MMGVGHGVQPQRRAVGRGRGGVAPRALARAAPRRRGRRAPSWGLFEFVSGLDPMFGGFDRN